MEVNDSLPYIDPEISQLQRDQANLLIQQELSKDYQKSLHPSVPELPASRLNELSAQEIERVAAGRPLIGGIDLTRYENSEQILPDSEETAIRNALRTTYTNTTYLRDRQTNITLLEDLGKNAWLVGNLHIEDIQKRLNDDLIAIKARSEDTNKARKATQEESRGELLSLVETWKDGIGKIIETQIATDGLRQELIRKRKSHT